MNLSNIRCSVESMLSFVVTLTVATVPFLVVFFFSAHDPLKISHPLAETVGRNSNALSLYIAQSRRHHTYKTSIENHKHNYLRYVPNLQSVRDEALPTYLL